MLEKREIKALKVRSLVKEFEDDKNRFFHMAKTFYDSTKAIVGNEPDKLRVANALAGFLAGDDKTLDKLSDGGIDITDYRSVIKWTRMFAKYILSETYDEIIK